jgi:DNA-binding transcriptional LysR family regulator
VILNLVESAETDIAHERMTPRGNLRISLPLSFGIKRIAPLLLRFAERYPEVGLDMDYSDRRVSLIEEGFDLSIRITRSLAANDVARKLGSAKLMVVAAPDYLSRHGRPQHPTDLLHHECLGYTIGGANSPWPFVIDGHVQSVAVRSRVNGNNGEVLVEAAAQGLGITYQPDFIIGNAIENGRLHQILTDFPIPELEIYAMLPGNRHIPHRVRVLMDDLQDKLGP